MRYRINPGLAFVLGAGLAALTPGAARAGTCRVSVTRAVNFGNYNPLSATPDTARGRISVACHGKGRLSIALSTGSSGSYTPRSMQDSAGDVLDYNLYTKASLTVIWGNGTEGTGTVSRRFHNNTKRARIHGQIPAGQNVPAGSYSDTITVTVTF